MGKSDFIPYTPLLAGSLKNIYFGQVCELLNFSPNQESNSNSKYDSLIQIILTLDNVSYDMINPLLNQIKDLESESLNIKKEAEDILKGVVETFNEKLNKILEQSSSELINLQDKNTEVNRLLEITKELAKGTSIAHHADKFNDEAKNNNKFAKRWLGATIGLGIITILFAVLNITLFKNLYITSELPQSIQFVFSKVIIFSILYYGLMFCSRNYKANRHNFIVNKHRFNALKTFEAFVAPASGDQQTKNAVLLRTTETIFSPAITGYLSKEPDNQGSPAIMEIFRSFTGKSDSTSP